MRPEAATSLAKDDAQAPCTDSSPAAGAASTETVRLDRWEGQDQGRDEQSDAEEHGRPLKRGAVAMDRRRAGAPATWA